MAALAQASRLEIFRALVVAGTEGMTPSALSDALGVAANTLSFHLKELVNAGLATSRQAGRFIYYSANYPAMNELLAYLTEQCCGGQPCGEPVPVCLPQAANSSPTV